VAGGRNSRRRGRPRKGSASPGLAARRAAGAGGSTTAAGPPRKLTVEEAGFYATVYESARRGCLGELRRRGCGEAEAEELFATAFERVMESVNPIERSFSAAEMVAFVKRAAWRCRLDELYHRGLRPEVELSHGYSVADPSAESPEEVVEEREAAAIALEVLATLSERDREVFCQRHQLELTPQEIVERTPGLTPRTYRKIIQRANARALAAFERIEGGERCEEMGSLLRRYVAEESPQHEQLAVESHLAHCVACRQAGVQMRGFLLDVASTLGAGSSALASHRLAGLSSRLLEMPIGAAHAILAAVRAVRERVRDVLFRVVGTVPGGGEATVGPAVASTSAKVASVCAAGLAAGACVAAGVVPGVGGLVSFGHGIGGPARARVERSRPQPGASAAPGTAGALTVPGNESAPQHAEQKAKRSTRSGGRGGGEAVAPVARKASESQQRTPESVVSARESSTVTGNEFGAESGQPAQAPAASPPSVSSGSARPSGSGGGGSESGSSPQTKPSAEFGF
jgi:RNA polymerase sigma factor (sigma-70 family)